MKPSHVFSPSLGSWICISASWSMVLQLLLWLPGPIHPQQTADEAGLIAVFSWRKLNTQSRGSFTALPAILLNCRRSCQSHDHAKPSYISKERLAKWSPWLLRGWHSRVLYSSPRKLPDWKKEAHASALGLLLLVTTLQKHFFQNSLSLVLKDPLTPQGQLSARMAKGTLTRSSHNEWPKEGFALARILRPFSGFNWIDYHLRVHYKDWFKKDERLRFKKLKLQNSLKKNIGINLHVLGWGNEFLSYDTKARQRKEIIGKLDFIEIKNFHASEDTIKEVKRQVIEWGKYL